MHVKATAFRNGKRALVAQGEIMDINFSLTLFCVIAVLLAVAGGFVGSSFLQDAIHGPGMALCLFSLGIGFALTHGGFYSPVYEWSLAHLRGDGNAGVALSQIVGFLAEITVAALPLAGGITWSLVEKKRLKPQR